MTEQELARLNEAFGRKGAVVFETSPLGGPVAVLRHGEARAAVALFGAHVLAWNAGPLGDVLWLSPAARLDAGKGIRGGVPVCWPWFADHPTEKALPAHGFVRTRMWTVAGAAGAEDGASLTLSLDAHDTGLWPFSARVELAIRLDDGLALTLTTRNTGSHAFDLTEALHTYFRVGDVTTVRIDGLEGCAYLDKLDGFARKRQQGPIGIASEVDRIYVGDTGAIRLADPSLGRGIGIHSEGSRSAVVWNPWIDKAARLGDMGPEGHRHMVCIETANAGDDVIRLAPGATHTLSARYAVKAL